jgi:hypothetical protein
MTERERLLDQATGLAEEGYEAFRSGAAGRSRALNEESLALARQATDPEATVRALAGLMGLARRLGAGAQAARSRPAAEAVRRAR